MEQRTSKQIKIENHAFMQEVVRMFREQGRKSVTFTVHGRSMHPLIGDGRDQVELVPPLEPRVGQVVLAQIHPRTYALHRIIAIDGDTITMQGDGNPNTHIETFKRSDIVGTATAFIRKGKRISTDSRPWRTYSAAWMFLRPLRRYLLGFYHRIIMKIF